jgi:hypothetical protein
MTVVIGRRATSTGTPGRVVMERVLRSFELAQDGRRRRAHVAWLEASAANAVEKIDDEAIRRGWFHGKESFKDRLLMHLEKPSEASGGTRNRTGSVSRLLGSCRVSGEWVSTKGELGKSIDEV